MGSFGKWNEDAEWEVVRFGVSCSFISIVAELLSARRSLFIFIPIWVPRDLSVRDSSNTNKKKGSSEFEAGGWIDIEGKAKEAKRKAQNFFSSFDAKTLVSTGSFGKWNEDAEWEVVRFGVSCSFISIVAELLSVQRFF
jgi:hypothetical protein